MTTVTHTITTTVQHGHDLLTLAVQIIPPLASVAVAAIALRFSDRQNRRTLDASERQTEKTLDVSRRQSEVSRLLSERQARNEEAKIRSDLYDRRYAAWREQWDAAIFIYKAIVNRKIGEEIVPQAWVAYDDATHKLFFLFSQAVFDAASQLREELFSLNMAKVRQENPSPTASLDGTMAAMDAFIAALKRSDDALENFKQKTGKEIAVVNWNEPVATA